MSTALYMLNHFLNYDFNSWLSCNNTDSITVDWRHAIYCIHTEILSISHLRTIFGDLFIQNTNSSFQKYAFENHEDVIKWKHFPRYWPFVRSNSPVTGEFPAQGPVTRSFDVFFDLRLTKRLSKLLWGWWFETPPWGPVWRDCYVCAQSHPLNSDRDISNKYSF